MLLCETFLTPKTAELVNIPDYKLIHNDPVSSKGGGTTILIKSNIAYKLRKNLNCFDEKQFESTIIEITLKNGKPVTVHSLYRSPNTNENCFSARIENLIHKIQSSKKMTEIILGMDHNMDLLKSSMHPPTQNLLDTLINNELMSTITRPSKITQTSAILIDNIFISNQLHKNFDSTLLLEDLSDHLPTLALLKQTKITNKEPLFFETCKLNENKLGLVKKTLRG